MTMAWDILLMLTAVAFVAGFIDAIAGGGGLITVPALILSGLNPVVAIATNKLQASFGSFSATWSFARQGRIQWKTALPIAVMSGLGGASGAMLVHFINMEWLKWIIPFLLIAVAIYFLCSPKLKDEPRPAKMPYFLFAMTIAPLIGLYDGFFGPGTGSFFTVALIGVLGLGLVNAIAHTKLANFACNIGSLVVFLSKGLVLIPIGLCMAVGAFLGAQLGAKCAVRFGVKIIKPLLIIVSVSLAIKLLFDPSHPIYNYF